MVDAFESEFQDVGSICFPVFSGLRIMMMPVRLETPASSLPDSMSMWRRALVGLVSLGVAREGVGYLTIDESFVDAGTTHRRPGLHVDGVGPDGRAAGWGGGGKYAANGMLVASDVVGCVGYRGAFRGVPAANGDCSHLREQATATGGERMLTNRVYSCGALCVHESLPMPAGTRRTFVRLSMPSDCPWYEGYTRNPTGVEPTGPVHSRRSEFMGYRA